MKPEGCGIYQKKAARWDRIQRHTTLPALLEHPMNDTTSQDARIIDATRQWLEKAVIGLNLCPFAKSVYVKHQVRLRVSHARHLDAFLEQLDEELEFLAAADPDAVDTTLLIHPTLFPDFEPFYDMVGMAEEAVREHDLEGVLQVASFHPRFQFEGTQPDDIGNYTNRAPYPTLHLIREASLEKALATYPDPEAIYERNIETLEKMGREGWQALGIPSAEGRPEDSPEDSPKDSPESGP